MSDEDEDSPRTPGSSRTAGGTESSRTPGSSKTKSPLASPLSRSTTASASSGGTSTAWVDSDILGTDMYIAPEVYEGEYSPLSDAFAVGVILYRLATGEFPFPSWIYDDERGENYVGHPKMSAIGHRLRYFWGAFFGLLSWVFITSSVPLGRLCAIKSIGFVEVYTGGMFGK